MSVTIDVHHHILPDFFWRETNDSAHPVGGIAPPVWDEASALAFMDDAGIDDLYHRTLREYAQAVKRQSGVLV